MAFAKRQKPVMSSRKTLWSNLQDIEEPLVLDWKPARELVPGVCQDGLKSMKGTPQRRNRKVETLGQAARRLLQRIDAQRKASERPQNGSEKFMPTAINGGEVADQALGDHTAREGAGSAIGKESGRELARRSAVEGAETTITRPRPKQLIAGEFTVRGCRNVLRISDYQVGERRSGARDRAEAVVLPFSVRSVTKWAW